MDFLNKIGWKPSQKSTVPLPPEDLQNVVGGGDFEAIGQHLADYFIKYCDLKPSEKVLDVGCGCGRVALPLTRYLTRSGCLAGFDTYRPAIDWCNANIHERFPNFHFFYADIYNSQYNPKGTVQTKDYRFPFEDEVFDFIYLTSIFTHMPPSDMEHYISEINRVLKVNGRWLATYYLFNNGSLPKHYNGPIEYKENDAVVFTLDFHYDHGVYRTVDSENPSLQVSYDEEYLRSVYLNNHSRIQEPVRYGTWSKGQTSIDFQDVIIATKIK